VLADLKLGKLASDLVITAGCATQAEKKSDIGDVLGPFLCLTCKETLHSFTLKRTDNIGGIHDA